MAIRQQAQISIDWIERVPREIQDRIPLVQRVVFGCGAERRIANRADVLPDELFFRIDGRDSPIDGAQRRGELAGAKRTSDIRVAEFGDTEPADECLRPLKQILRE